MDFSEYVVPEESDLPATSGGIEDALEGAGEEQGAPAASEEIPAEGEPEAVKVKPAEEPKPAEGNPQDKALAHLGFENRDLKRKFTAAERELEQYRKRDQEGVFIPKSEHQRYLEMLRDYDPDAYNLELHRSTKEDAKREIKAELSQPNEELSDRPDLSEAVNDASNRLDASLRQQFPELYADQAKNKAFLEAVQEAFPTQEAFALAVMASPMAVTKIAKGVSQDFRFKELEQKLADGNRKDRVNAQSAATVTTKSNSTSVNLTPAQKKYCADRKINEADYARFLPGGSK